MKISNGELRQGGDFLPSVRKLAEDIGGVNFNTVSKAYKELSEQGIIEVQRGEGYTVKVENLEDFNNEILLEIKNALKKRL